MGSGSFLQTFETLPDSILPWSDEYLQFWALSQVACLAELFQELVQEKLPFTDKLVLKFACHFLVWNGRNYNTRISGKKHISEHKKFRISAKDINGPQRISAYDMILGVCLVTNYCLILLSLSILNFQIKPPRIYLNLIYHSESSDIYWNHIFIFRSFQLIIEV